MEVSCGAPVAYCLLLVWGLCTPKQAQADTCYSKHSGFISCPNGCCGADDNQECCSQVFLIVGLAVGAFLVALVVVVVVVCWVCKDCRPKMCSGWGGEGSGEGGSRRGSRRRRHERRVAGRNGHPRRVLVHPVQPPDYSTATQERAPSVQPGLNNRILPGSPPPPYMETICSSQPHSPKPDKDHPTTVAPAATSLFVVSDTNHPVNRPAASDNEARQSFHHDAVPSNGESDSSSPHQQNNIVLVESSGSERTPSSRSNSNVRLSSSYTTNNNLSPGSSPPSETPLTNSSNSGSASDHLIHVQETPRRNGGSRQVQSLPGLSPQRSARGPGLVSNRVELHTVRETAEDGSQLELV